MRSCGPKSGCRRNRPHMRARILPGLPHTEFRADPRVRQVDVGSKTVDQERCPA